MREMTIDILIPTIGRDSLLTTLNFIEKYNTEHCNLRLVMCADQTGNSEFSKSVFDKFTIHKNLFYDSLFILTNGITETYRTLFENIDSDLCIVLEDDDYLYFDKYKHGFKDIISDFSNNFFLSCEILNTSFSGNINPNFNFEYDVSINREIFDNFPDIFDGEFQFGMCIFRSSFIKDIGKEVFSELKYYGRTYNDEFIFLNFLLKYNNFYTKFINDCYLVLNTEDKNYSHHNYINSLLGINYIAEIYQLCDDIDWYNKMKKILIREINYVLKDNNYLPLFEKEFDFENKTWHKKYEDKLLLFDKNDEEKIKEYKKEYIDDFLNKRLINIGRNK